MMAKKEKEGKKKERKEGERRKRGRREGSKAEKRKEEPPGFSRLCCTSPQAPELSSASIDWSLTPQTKLKLTIRFLRYEQAAACS